MITDSDLKSLLSDYGINKPDDFLDGIHKENKDAIKQLFDNKDQIKGLLNRELSNIYGYDPVSAPRENLGMNPNMLPIGVQSYQGAQFTGNPVSLQGMLNTQDGGGIKGNMFGGRLGTEMNLSPEQLLALGVTGGGTRMTYGVGTPYEGQANRSDIMGIDATLRNLARNEEFGAALQKDPKMNPFLSLFYRKQF